MGVVLHGNGSCLFELLQKQIDRGSRRSVCRMIGGQVREILLRKAFRRIVIRLARQICDGRSKLLCQNFQFRGG